MLARTLHKKGATAMARDTHERFSHITLTLHWLLAIGLVAMFTIGLSIEDVPEGDARIARVGLHVSIGLLVLVLGVIRLAWRVSNGLPKPAGDHLAWERLLARVTHVILLIVPIYMPLSGMAFALGEGYAIGFFGITFVTAGAENEAFKEIGEELHEFGAFVLALFVVLHTAGALKHHFLDRDATLRRMLGGRLAPDR
jgi:cytochrome b561